MKYDFGGYATRINLKCSDGRVIRRDAFRDNDGQVVPLVWQHLRDKPDNVLGHALLENRADGVYCYCSFNDTDAAKNAKKLVQHGDIKALSIYANQLQQSGSNVTHGQIREVSLVMAGANPGAFIDNVCIKHSDGSSSELDDEAIISAGPVKFKMVVKHADTDEDDEDYDDDEYDEDDDDEYDEDDDDEYDEDDDDEYDEDDDDEYDEDDDENMEHADGPSVKDVFESMNEDQKKVVYIMMAEYAKSLKGGDAEHSDYDEGGTDMPKTRNIFEGQDTPENSISHEEMRAIFEDGPRYGSLRKAALEHGINDIDILFPEARASSPVPELIMRQQEWVAKVWNATHKSPFSRIKSIAADLTEDDARAKGYIKGNKKTEEQFGLLKRVTTPQTIYKKQALDRDDIIDITDFDVVAWLKQEMRMMLNEELSRAILVGDGRSSGSPDKINPMNIRPIWTDDDLYTIKYEVEMPESGDATDKTNAIIDSANLARIDYKGSGSPTFYTTSKTLTTMLLAKDKIGRRLYNTVSELASALRVKEIVEVAVMDELTRTPGSGEKNEGQTMELIGIIVNLADYTVGADKGGQVSMFEDFDIDYNKEKYLIETRCSGTLTHPYSAIVLEKKQAAG